MCNIFWTKHHKASKCVIATFSLRCHIYPWVFTLLKTCKNNLLGTLDPWINHIFSIILLLRLCENPKTLLIKFWTPGERYRPTGPLVKTLERIIDTRLIWFLETNGIITNSQCGFRSKRSTVDHLETFVREAFIKKEHLSAVFLDLV